MAGVDGVLDATGPNMKIVGNYYFFYTNFLSNWHLCEFMDHASGKKFITSEQAYMWYKANFFNDFGSQAALAHYGLHPKIAKDLGGKVQGFIPEVWDIVRYGFMVYVNMLKFSQNEELLTKLLDTKNLILVEASPVDKNWGIGLSEKADDAILIDEKNWTGKNLLGKALMDVRTILRKEVDSSSFAKIG